MPTNEPPVLVGERLQLRGVADPDLAALQQLCGDPTVMAHFPAPLSPAETSALLAGNATRWARDGMGLWAVELLDTAPTGPAQCIGLAGLSSCDWLAPGAVEVSWRLAAAHWGRGYGPEAATLALAFAFLGLQLGEVVSFTVPANTRSQRVMEKIGMVRDRARDFDHPRVEAATHPHLVGHVVWSLTREDWLALHADHV
ncbi:MAG: GNAT family N-acetyltransferase [Actinomycetes bacterium]